ncbi:MAG: hypothetical protein ABGU93_06955 [Acetobacterium sp.]|uniref:hypothetical protein n=1 Tax=Acetobacterium sp. TaxID=1872094 RepID=UPI003241C60D
MTNNYCFDPPDPKESKYPECPECYQECDTIFYSKKGDVVGCENCISSMDAWEWHAREEKNEGPDPDRLFDEYMDRQTA